MTKKIELKIKKKIEKKITIYRHIYIVSGIDKKLLRRMKDYAYFGVEEPKYFSFEVVKEMHEDYDCKDFLLSEKSFNNLSSLFKLMKDNNIDFIKF